EVDRVGLDKKDLRDLTIRAARRFRPVLTLGEVSEADTALFRVHDGRLHLEGLELLLKPSKKSFTAQAVVALAGDGECVMRECVVTLDRNDFDATLTLASLAAAGRAMKLDMEPARSRDQGPRLALENCFVRGDGDLLSSPTARPCTLELKN